MLKTQQGDYVGYDALEKDITISKLPLSVSKEGLSYKEEATNENEPRKETTADTEDNLDLSMLKSTSHVVNHRHRNNIHNGHTFHNSYTIYEEGSDVSGNESGARSVKSCPSSESLNEDPGGERNSEWTFTRTCRKHRISFYFIYALVHLQQIQKFPLKMEQRV